MENIHPWTHGLATSGQKMKRMFLVALGVLPPAPLPGIATVGLISKQNIKEGDQLETD